MRPIAALPPELTDVVTIVSGSAVLGGALAWIGWAIGAVILGRELSVERWVGQGAGIGSAAGLLVATVYILG